MYAHTAPWPRLVMAVLFSLCVTFALGAAPEFLSYQGQLTDADGNAITDPTALIFTVLVGGTKDEPASTGEIVYQEQVQVDPDDTGSFRHLIGAGTAKSVCDEDGDGTAGEVCDLTASDFDVDGTPVFLELQVVGDPDNRTLLPRHRIASVAYALNTDNVSLDTAYRIGAEITADQGPLKIVGDDLEIWSGNQALTCNQVSGATYISNKADFGGNGALGGGVLHVSGSDGVRLNYGDSGSAGTVGMALGNTGNIGIGTTNPLKRLHVDGDGIRIDGGESASSENEIYFEDNGQIRSHDENHRIIFYRTANVMELREYGDIILSSGARGSRNEALLIRDNGDVKVSRGGDFGVWLGNKALSLRVDGNDTFITNKADFVGNGAEGGGDLIITGSDGITLKYGDEGSSGTSAMRINTAGQVGIGRDPGRKLDVEGGARIRGTIYVDYLDSAGTDYRLCSTNQTSGRIGRCSSSRKSKRNIAPLGLPGIETVLDLRPVEFDWKVSGTHSLGFVAEEVAAVDPLLATYDEDGAILGVKYDQLTAVLAKALQEQQEQLDVERERADRLETRVRRLEQALAEILESVDR